MDHLTRLNGLDRNLKEHLLKMGSMSISNSRSLQAITGLEQQVTTFNMVAPHPGGGKPTSTMRRIAVDYISFLTDDGVPHMAALSSLHKKQLEVAAISNGVPRHLLVSWDVAFKGKRVPNADKTIHGLQAAVVSAVSKTLQSLGHDDFESMGLGDKGLKNRIQVFVQPDRAAPKLACSLSLRPVDDYNWKRITNQGHLVKSSLTNMAK